MLLLKEPPKVICIQGFIPLLSETLHAHNNIIIEVILQERIF